MHSNFFLEQIRRLVKLIVIFVSSILWLSKRPLPLFGAAISPNINFIIKQSKLTEVAL